MIPNLLTPNLIHQMRIANYKNVWTRIDLSNIGRKRKRRNRQPLLSRDAYKALLRRRSEGKILVAAWKYPQYNLEVIWAFWLIL